MEGCVLAASIHNDDLHFIRGITLTRCADSILNEGFFVQYRYNDGYKHTLGSNLLALVEKASRDRAPNWSRSFTSMEFFPAGILDMGYGFQLDLYLGDGFCQRKYLTFDKQVRIS